MPMYNVTASIVTYKNDHKLLNRAIDSFLQTGLDVKLYVVDNSPTDKISKLCSDNRIEYIFNNANIGFGAAHNIALREAKSLSRYHLVLNPDVYFERNVIETLKGYMDSDPTIGLVLPKTLNRDQSIQYLPKLLPTPLDFLIRWFPFPAKIKEMCNTNYELRAADYNSIFETPIVSGCFTFINTNLVKQGLFYDERFFMYFEDFDFSRRAGRFFKTMYFPDVSIIHGYERGNRRNVKLTFYFVLSSIRYFNKWGWFHDEQRKLINKKALEKSGRTKKRTPA